MRVDRLSGPTHLKVGRLNLLQSVGIYLLAEFAGRETTGQVLCAWAVV